MNSRRRLTPVIWTVAVVVLVTCETRPSPSSNVTVRVPASGLDPANTDFDRFERLMFQLRGTPVVVNLWASWCGPCEDEMPALRDAARRYGDRIRFLGVDTEDQRDAASAFLREHDIPYPSVVDPTGSVHNGLGFVGLPDTVFYAADGSIVSTWSGPLTQRTLQRGLEDLLAASG